MKQPQPATLNVYTQVRQSKIKISRFGVSPKILNAKSKMDTLYSTSVQCVSFVIQKILPANPDNFCCNPESLGLYQNK